MREALLAELSPGLRREHHQSLAEALLATGRASVEPRALVRHLEGAERLEEAAHQAEIAGRHAEDALAFDRAAEFYAIALRLGCFSPAAHAELSFRLCTSLTNAGRAAEAAAAFATRLREADTTVQWREGTRAS